MRDAVSIAALCEVAEESRSRATLDAPARSSSRSGSREAPDGIEEAEAATRELQHVLGVPPHVASPARLDARQAARRLELALDLTAPSSTAAAAAPRRSQTRSGRTSSRVATLTRSNLPQVEGGGFFPFGGDPEEIMRGLREFAEQQAEGVKEAQREQFATLTLPIAVELTQVALAQVSPRDDRPADGPAARRHARAVPRGRCAVSAARQGFMREDRSCARESGLSPRSGDFCESQ